MAYNDLTPQEIVAAPLTLYAAPTDTAAPTITAAPAGAWTLLGTSGVNDYDQSGVTVSHSQTITTWTPLGATVPNKAWRTGEDLTISVTLADITPTTYAIALNDATVTTTTGVSGVGYVQTIQLYQGLQVQSFALLARGVSPLNNALPAQYYVPCCYQSANPAPVFKLGAPAELALTFSALLDPAGGGFGSFSAGHS